MLYLKLAQLRSDVSEAKQDASSCNMMLESGDNFKLRVKQQAGKLIQEAKVNNRNIFNVILHCDSLLLFLSDWNLFRLAGYFDILHSSLRTTLPGRASY